ncbi:MAG: hypothetical protein ACXV49_10055, partial [Halobacteriota archaeon]
RCFDFAEASQSKLPPSLSFDALKSVDTGFRVVGNPDARRGMTFLCHSTLMGEVVTIDCTFYPGK